MVDEKCDVVGNLGLQRDMNTLIPVGSCVVGALLRACVDRKQRGAGRDLSMKFAGLEQLRNVTHVAKL